MQYNIGDMVVRHLNGQNDWGMVGIITAKRPKYHTKNEQYYTIRWADTRLHTGSDHMASHMSSFTSRQQKNLSKNT